MDEPKIEEFCAVVVGSGFGAAVTANRLADCFKTMCVLERGREYGPQDFPRLKLPSYLSQDPELVTSQRLPDVSRFSWMVDQGLFDLRNLGQLRVVQAAGWGGGSLIYAGVTLRPPDKVFDSWPEEYRGRGLDREFDRVTTELEAGPMPEEWRERMPKSRALRDAAAKLRRPLKEDVGDGLLRDFFYPPVAINYQKCNGCGNCTVGCQEGAKNTLDHNYLSALREHDNVAIRTLCEVLRITNKVDDDGYFIDYYDHLMKLEKTMRAEHVFLGAGAVGTTELLLRSRKHLQAREPKWGSLGGLAHVGKGFFANGDNLGVVFDTDAAASPTQGPTITSCVLHVEPPQQANGERPWFLLQDGGVPAHLEAALGLFRSPHWLLRNRQSKTRQRDRTPAANAFDDGFIADVTFSLGDLARAFLRKPTSPTEVAPDIPTRWTELLPQSLRPFSAQVLKLSDRAYGELLRLDALVLEKLARETLFLTRWVGTPEHVATRVADAVAELYTPLRYLLRKNSGIQAIVDIAKYLAFSGGPTARSIVFLTMGPDQAGTLCLEREKLRVRWNTHDENTRLIALQERLMRDFAVEMGGELRTNPDWALGRRAVTVHAQGGCGMCEPISDGAQETIAGVTRPNGEVYGFPNLYVVDAAAFPSSVGANPSCTIAAVAEHKAALFRSKRERDTRMPLPAANPTRAKTARKALKLDIASATSNVQSQPLCLTWHERMTGWLSTSTGDSKRDFRSRMEALERSADPQRRNLDLDLRVILPELDTFLTAFERRQPLPVARITGQIRVDGVQHQLQASASSMRFVRRFKDGPKPTLFMLTYRLRVQDGWSLRGYKILHHDWGHDLWPDLTTLFIHRQPEPGWGILRVPLRAVLGTQLPSFDAYVAHGDPTLSCMPHEHPRDTESSYDARYRPDEAMRAWALARFGATMARALSREYLP